MSEVHVEAALPRRAVALLAVCLWVAACDGPTEPAASSPPQPAPPAALRLEATTPTELAGTVATEATPAPAVRVLDARDRPVEGIMVSFTPVRDGGILAASAARTDADGSATVARWTLPEVAGTYTLTASVSGGAKLVFTARATPGPIEGLLRTDGEGQAAPAGDRLPRPLRVEVVDGYSNPIPDVSVAFTVISGGGTVANAMSATGPDGTASSGAWTLGSSPGVQQVRAESGTLQVVFSAVAYAEPTSLSGRIAFVSRRDGNADIYAVDPDGSGLQRLTTDPAHDDDPVWSPDGTRLAFSSDREGAFPSLYVMDPDGSAVTRRTTGAAYEPAWSPDGSVIAFSTGQSIAVFDASDASVRLLIDLPGVHDQPSWSPDGRRLAFVSDRAAYDFVFNVYTMNADGSDQRLLTSFTSGSRSFPWHLHPTWSPDGSMIAFAYGRVINEHQELPDLRFHVAIMSADGTFLGDLAWAGDIPWRELLDPGSLAWSPDGAGIAYSFVDCDQLHGGPCSQRRSVKYVSLDRTRQGTIVEYGSDPTWRR